MEEPLEVVCGDLYQPGGSVCPSMELSGQFKEGSGQSADRNVDIQVHVDWVHMEMKTLLGAGSAVMLIELWLIIWLLVQTEDFVKDKPSE